MKISSHDRPYNIFNAVNSPSKLLRIGTEKTYLQELQFAQQNNSKTRLYSLILATKSIGKTRLSTQDKAMVTDLLNNIAGQPNLSDEEALQLKIIAKELKINTDSWNLLTPPVHTPKPSERVLEELKMAAYVLDCAYSKLNKNPARTFDWTIGRDLHEAKIHLNWAIHRKKDLPSEAGWNKNRIEYLLECLKKDFGHYIEIDPYNEKEQTINEIIAEIELLLGELFIKEPLKKGFFRGFFNR
jgi:hypothetical protein